MNHNQEPDDQLIVAATTFELVVRAEEAADAVVIPIIDRAEFATDPMAARFLNLALLGEDIKIIENRRRAFRAGRAARKALGKLNQSD